MRNPSFETDCEKKVAKSGLGPYFPLISGIFVFRSGLGFSFQALEVSVPRVRKRPFSLTKTNGQPIRYASGNYWFKWSKP